MFPKRRRVDHNTQFALLYQPNNHRSTDNRNGMSLRSLCCFCIADHVSSLCVDCCPFLAEGCSSYSNIESLSELREICECIIHTQQQHQQHPQQAPPRQQQLHQQPPLLRNHGDSTSYSFSNNKKREKLQAERHETLFPQENEESVSALIECMRSLCSLPSECLFDVLLAISSKLVLTCISELLFMMERIEDGDEGHRHGEGSENSDEDENGDSDMKKMLAGSKTDLMNEVWRVSCQDLHYEKMDRNQSSPNDNGEQFSFRYLLDDAESEMKRADDRIRRTSSRNEDNAYCVLYWNSAVRDLLAQAVEQVSCDRDHPEDGVDDHLRNDKKRASANVKRVLDVLAQTSILSSLTLTPALWRAMNVDDVFQR